MQNVRTLSKSEAQTIKDDNFYVKIFDSFLSLKDSDLFFQKLSININWRREQICVWGKKRTTKRRVAWYADKGKSYSYSGSTFHPSNWNQDLLKIKRRVESIQLYFLHRLFT